MISMMGRHHNVLRIHVCQRSSLPALTNSIVRADIKILPSTVGLELFVPKSILCAVIKEFGKNIGAEQKQVQGLIRLAKQNGEKLGFLS